MWTSGSQDVVLLLPVEIYDDNINSPTVAFNVEKRKGVRRKGVRRIFLQDQRSEREGCRDRRELLPLSLAGVEIGT